MNIRLATLTAAAVLTAALARTAAAAAPETPPVFAKLKPKVGAWAEYSLVSKKGDDVKRQGVIRMSIVGKTADGFWLEQKMTIEIPKPKKDNGPTIIKMLLGAEGAQKVYMKSGPRVMDMSGMMAGSARKNQAAVDKAKTKEVGEESIEVAAGKYKATRYSFDDGKNTGDTWVKPGVGPYGLIKQVHTSGKTVTTLELQSAGGDAKSEVDETTAQSMFGGMMGGGSGAASGSGSNSSAPSGFGSMFQNALQRKAAGSQ